MCSTGAAHEALPGTPKCRPGIALVRTKTAPAMREYSHILDGLSAGTALVCAGT